MRHRPSKALCHRLSTALIFALGVVASIASTGPAADLSGASDEQTVVLNGDNPSAVFGALATLRAPDATTTGGEVGLNVAVDGADGSLVYTLRSETTGEQTTGDIVDAQAQGSARIGIDAFGNCGDGCTDELTIEFERTDEALDGDLEVTFSLDAFATTAAEATGDIELVIE